MPGIQLYQIDTLLTTPQIITSEFITINNPIQMIRFNMLAVWLRLIKNDSEKIQIRALAKLSKDTTITYKTPIKTVFESYVGIESEEYEFPDRDDNWVIEMETSSGIPFVELQIKAETVGLVPAQLLDCYVTKTVKSN